MTRPAFPIFLSFAIAAIFWSSSTALGQDTGPEKPVQFEEIVVTGSRLPFSANEAVGPVIILGKMDLERAATDALAQVLQDLPVQTGPTTNTHSDGSDGSARVNLRGLGDARTLVLLNGRRFIFGGLGADSSVDLNMIPLSMVERVEARVRELEQLPARESGLMTGASSATKGVFTMNGVKFHFDGLHGQKTGAFLDQRENYAAAAQYAHGEALDVFCYQGGFALHLAPKCTSVTGVDSSLPALEVAEENAKLNGTEIEWMEANAFDLLKDYASAGRQYDTVVLDPPAFAKTKRDLEAAARGYKELNLRALKMLRPGGVLVTCSCSYHFSEQELLEIVVAASLDAKRTVRLLEKRVQAKDHPILPAVPETAYLKAMILQAV